MQSNLIGSRNFAILGAVFMAVAGLFTIRELELDFGYSIAALLIALAVVAPRLQAQIQSVALAAFGLLGIATPILFLVGQRQTGMLVAIGTFCAGSIYLMWRERSKWSSFEPGDKAKLQTNRQSIVIWASMIISSLVFVWAFYFWFLTPLGDAFLARRLILTVLFVLVGLLLAIRSQRSPLPFLGFAGLAYLGAGVLKAIIYDTTHLTGMLRIGVFAGCGLLLLIGAKIANQKGAVS